MSGGLFLQQILMQHLVGFVVPHIELLFWISGFHGFFARQAEESNDAMDALTLQLTHQQSPNAWIGEKTVLSAPDIV